MAQPLHLRRQPEKLFYRETGIMFVLCPDNSSFRDKLSCKQTQALYRARAPGDRGVQHRQNHPFVPTEAAAVWEKVEKQRGEQRLMCALHNLHNTTILLRRNSRWYYWRKFSDLMD